MEKIILFLWLAHLDPWIVSRCSVSCTRSSASILQVAGARPLQAVAGRSGSRLTISLSHRTLYEPLSLQEETIAVESCEGVCVIKGDYFALITSLMTMRPAMESRVRGEKCGVIMMRRPASEKDSL